LRASTVAGGEQVGERRVLGILAEAAAVDAPVSAPGRGRH
jgi:hypothetical protein